MLSASLRERREKRIYTDKGERLEYKEKMRHDDDEEEEGDCDSKIIPDHFKTSWLITKSKLSLVSLG